MAHSFRTHLLKDLQQTIDNLIEGESTMKRALGRLQQVMSEDPDQGASGSSSSRTGTREADEGMAVAKREEADDEGVDEDAVDREGRFARAPDLSLPMHKLFLTPLTNGGPAIFEPSHFGSPQMQLEQLEKSLGTLRDLQDDSQEYVERLEEVRETLGEVTRQRDMVWTKIREGALEELKELDAI